MAAPEYVPRPAAEHPRVYESPPRRLGSWTNDRPGDFVGRQPVGPGLGSPGPDQGYMLKLARNFEGQLTLAEGEHEEDAIAGCMAVALKRASLFGRAPVIHDLTVAFTIWGFLAEPDPELLTLRRSLFEEVHLPHHYMGKRLIADAVPAESLRLLPVQVEQAVADDWRVLIKLPSVATDAAADSLLVVDDFSAVDVGVAPVDSEPLPVAESLVEPELVMEPPAEVVSDALPPPPPPVSSAPFATADITELAAQATGIVEGETAAEPEPAAAPEPATPSEPSEPAPVAAEAAPPPPTPAAPVTPASAMNTADITELAAEAKRALRNAPTAPGGPLPGTTPADAATPAPAEVPDEPMARRKAKPVAIPKDAEPEEVARLVAEAKQAFRRKPTAPSDDSAAAPDPDDTDPDAAT